MKGYYVDTETIFQPCNILSIATCPHGSKSSLSHYLGYTLR